MLEEETVFQAIYEHAIEKCGDRLEWLISKFGDEFPEKDWKLHRDPWFKNLMCYLMYEVPLPESGRTIAEDFAGSSELVDDDMIDNIMQMRNIVRSEFIVISTNDDLITIKDRKSGIKYKVRKVAGGVPLSPNMLITGRIHPFADHYRFTGIFMSSSSPMILDPEIFIRSYEKDEIKRIEEIHLRKSSSIITIMNRYPANWIDWMSRHYRIQKRLKKEKIGEIVRTITRDTRSIMKGFTPDSKEVLRICMEKGGYVKIGTLKDFEDDTSYFWKKKSRTPLGELRQAGYLFIGRMNIGGRYYRIAFIPKEVRECLNDLYLITEKGKNTTLDSIMDIS